MAQRFVRVARNRREQEDPPDDGRDGGKDDREDREDLQEAHLRREDARGPREVGAEDECDDQRPEPQLDRVAHCRPLAGPRERLAISTTAVFERLDLEAHERQDGQVREHEHESEDPRPWPELFHLQRSRTRSVDRPGSHLSRPRSHLRRAGSACPTRRRPSFRACRSRRAPAVPARACAPSCRARRP